MPEPKITATERRVLDLYLAGFSREGDRTLRVRELTGLSEVGALLYVSQLIDTQRAAMYAPSVVRTLRHRRNQRSRSRRVRVA